MISARQTKNIIDYMFTSVSSGFIIPTAVLTATPSLYTTSNFPGAIILNGTITMNSGVLTNWTITDAVSTILAAGTNNTPVKAILDKNTMPSTVGSHGYYLNVYYTDTNGNNLSILASTVINVTTYARYGQLSNPSDNIVVPVDLTPFELGLATSDQNTIINTFNLVALNTARLVFTIPDSFVGTVTGLEDGVGLDILSQFNVIYDVTNLRTIYVSINVLTPATYNFKFIF